MSNLFFFWYFTIFFKINHLKKNTTFFFETQDFSAQKPKKFWFAHPEVET